MTIIDSKLISYVPFVLVRVKGFDSLRNAREPVSNSILRLASVARVTWRKSSFLVGAVSTGASYGLNVNLNPVSHGLVQLTLLSGLSQQAGCPPFKH